MCCPERRRAPRRLHQCAQRSDVHGGMKLFGHGDRKRSKWLPYCSASIRGSNPGIVGPLLLVPRMELWHTLLTWISLLWMPETFFRTSQHTIEGILFSSSSLKKIRMTHVTILFYETLTFALILLCGVTFTVGCAAWKRFASFNAPLHPRDPPPSTEIGAPSISHGDLDRVLLLRFEQVQEQRLRCLEDRTKCSNDIDVRPGLRRSLWQHSPHHKKAIPKRLLATIHRLNRVAPLRSPLTNIPSTSPITTGLLSCSFPTRFQQDLTSWRSAELICDSVHCILPFLTTLMAIPCHATSDNRDGATVRTTRIC